MEKTSKLVLLIILLIFQYGCLDKNQKMKSLQISEKNKIIRDYVVDNAIIAHRGTTYWAPEETEAAFRWARNMGADYLEVDIQRSKDGVLLALHDDNLSRTTDCVAVFPNDSIFTAANYTYQELMQLDAGTWFNLAQPNQQSINFSNKAEVTKSNHKAYSFSGLNISGDLDISKAIQHPSAEIYVGGKQYISTLEDVIMIAKGWRIARDENGERLFNLIVINSKPHYQFFYVKDTEDIGHRPGIYIETKEPGLYPNVENDLYRVLSTAAWNNKSNPIDKHESFYIDGKVNTGNTAGRIVLQTFSPKSLQKINELFKGEVPLCFLLWLGDPNLIDSDSIAYQTNINFAIKNNAHFIGPSISGEPNNYADLLMEWQAKLIHQSGLKIHAYSFDTEYQTMHYASRTDAMFTNRTELTLEYFKNQGLKKDIPLKNAKEILNELGY